MRVLYFAERRGFHTPGPLWDIYANVKSGAVVGVDFDVAVGQIAGPDRAF